VTEPTGSSEDPFAVLGLRRDASLTDVRDARRRLARELHPDVHPGNADAAAMQRVNAAFDACVGHLTGRRPLPDLGAAPGEPWHSPQPARTRPGPSPWPRRRATFVRGVEVDAPSFTIDALPAEAFEALLVVAAILGEVVDDDPPYVLECVLAVPSTCWCRLEVVPDAGSSTVTLAVGGIDSPDHPPAEDVRDVWVAELNRLGRLTP
jgi:hypothetical protein